MNAREAAYQAACRTLYNTDTTGQPSRDEIAHAIADAVRAALEQRLPLPDGIAVETDGPHNVGSYTPAPPQP